MAKSEVATADILRQLLQYEPDTGVLRWRERSVEMFRGGGHSADHNCAAWNAKYAGTIAGTPSGQGYLNVSIFDRGYRAHRVAWVLMTGEWPAEQVDHENLDRADNKWRDLRLATNSQNSANRNAYRNNASGRKGVSYESRSQKWRATIFANGKQVHLGLFRTKDEAAGAYDAAAPKYLGEYARQNVSKRAS